MGKFFFSKIMFDRNARKASRGPDAAATIGSKLPPVRTQRKSKRNRCGSVVVEFAVVAIPLFLFVFASIEFGRAIMVSHVMEEAARTGCRASVVGGATTESVEDAIESVIAQAGINEYTVEIEPEDFSTAEQWTPISITITATYEEMTWLPMPGFLNGQTFTASCLLPKECPSDS